MLFSPVLRKYFTKILFIFKFPKILLKLEGQDQQLGKVLEIALVEGLSILHEQHQYCGICSTVWQTRSSEQLPVTRHCNKLY